MNTTRAPRERKRATAARANHQPHEGRETSTMSDKDTRSLKERRDEFERGIITEALAACGGNVRRAARKLGMSRTGLYKRIRILGISVGAAEEEETAAGGDGGQD